MEKLKKINFKINEELYEKARESFEEVIPMFLMSQINLVSKMNEMATPINGHKVTIGISLTGDIDGSIFLTMNLDVARKVVSLMTMQEDISELNDLHESALREILNMISGTFVSKISNLINPNSGENYIVDISSPICIVSDSNIAIWIDKSSHIKELLFNIEDIGEVIMYLGLKAI